MVIVKLTENPGSVKKQNFTSLIYVFDISYRFAWSSNPMFEDHFFVFKKAFSEKSVLMYG